MEAEQNCRVRRRIVIDTDIGTDVDDVLAIALALASDELEVVAITVVGRQSEYRAQIANEYLRLANRTEVPVFVGCDVPIEVGNVIRFNWKGNEGTGLFSKNRPESAVDALIRLFTTNSDLELVAIGPLTNVASALQLMPSIAKNIKRLWLMGGHLGEVSYLGNVFPHGIDYNLCADPAASLNVLTSDIPEIRLVTADVTLQTWMDSTDLKRLENVDNPFLKAVVREIAGWTPHQREYLMKYGELKDPSDNVAFLHDPLVIGCLLDQSFCTFEILPVEPIIVFDKKERRIFRTVVHRDSRENVTVRMECAVTVDAKRFQRFFVERLIDYFK